MCMSLDQKKVLGVLLVATPKWLAGEEVCMEFWFYPKATETRLVRLGSFLTETNGQWWANCHTIAIKVLLEISV